MMEHQPTPQTSESLEIAVEKLRKRLIKAVVALFTPEELLEMVVEKNL